MSTSTYRILLFLFVSSLLTLPFASAQEIQEQVEVELVQVDLIATDSKGAFVTDLKAEDFVLKEDGKVQTISHFYNSSTEQTRFPLTISFVVDTSFSMQETVAGMTRIEIALKAAELVMDQLKPEDKIELIEFNNEPATLVPFTSDLNSIRERFKTVDFQKANTAMHDAVLHSVKEINEQSGRKIIVMFSDGMDSASKSVEEDVIDSLRKSDATIITFYSEFSRLNFPAAGGGMGDFNNPNRVRIRAGEDALRRYCEMTGGQFYSFRKEEELAKAIENFRKFVQSQYTIAYTPPPPAKKRKDGWRKIKVECKRKGVKLQHRDGYSAS